MERIKSAMMGAVLTGVAVVGAPTDAHSYALPAMAGHSWRDNQTQCFSSSWSQVSNTCTGSPAPKLLVPIQVDSHIQDGGNISFYATGPAGGGGGICLDPVKCRVVVNNLANGILYNPAFVNLCGGALLPSSDPTT